MAEIMTMDRKMLPWAAKQLVSSMTKGNSIFDNAVQRTLVWSVEQKSLLIHSMIINAPIPPFYTVKTEDGKYDFLDGKQRSHAIFDFINDGFALKNVPTVPFDNGDEEDINDLTFSELPEDIQDAIRTYSLSIAVLEDIDEEQEAEIFYRLNRGVPLTKIESMRAICPSIKTIQDIALHPIFELCTTEKSRQKYIDEDLIIKSFAMLKMETPCLDLKSIRPFGETLEITKDEAKDLNGLYDRLLSIYQAMENPKAAKRILGRTHLVTLVKFFADHRDAQDEKLTNFLDRFFDGGKLATVSEVYNDNARSGSGHANNIQARLDELEKAFR